MKLHDICAMNDIPDRQARGFTVEDAEHKTEFFIVRQGVHIYGYLNRCPHAGVNLNWPPDRFPDSSEQLIQRSTHGA